MSADTHTALPRIFEGDAVVTIRRAPSISFPKARDLDLAVDEAQAAVEVAQPRAGVAQGAPAPSRGRDAAAKSGERRIAGRQF